MDFQQAIIELLGIQDVEVLDFKRYKKDRRVEIKVRQHRQACFCPRCGLQFAVVKEWALKELRAPALGIYQHVTIKFLHMRDYCEDCDRSAVAPAEWIHPKFESMTCGFAEVCGRLMEEITCEAVGRIMSADSKQM